MTVEQTSERLLKVGVAQFHVGRAPAKMMTMALGSCLGIVLFDAASHVGALAHAMHPRRERVRNNANWAKFVDSVIPIALEQMSQLGAERSRIVAKIFGGARMFESFAGCRGILQIGDENIATARTVLHEFGIPIVAECVGGTSGRTITFDVSDGSVRVRGITNIEEIY